MIHLKTYESFDIDKYKSFIKKYKKSDYISKGTVKTMKDLGIERAFSNLEENVHKCYQFFNKIDTDLLDELLLEVEHEYATVKNGNIEFKISVRPEYPLKEFTLGVESYGKMKEEVDVVDHIIRNIASNEESEKREMKEASKKDKKDYWYRYKFSRMRWINYYENVEINPVLKIGLDIGMDIDHLHYNPFGGGEEPHEIKDRRTKINDISKLLEKEVFARYLDYMGYGDLTFSIQQVNSYYNTNSLVVFEIKMRNFTK